MEMCSKIRHKNKETSLSMSTYSLYVSPNGLNVKHKHEISTARPADFGEF